jgi:hypothetical protein
VNEPLSWRPIPGTGYPDQEADLPGGYYAQAGPEAAGRWSWTILRADDHGEQEIDGGYADGEDAAKQAAGDWRPPAVAATRDAPAGHPPRKRRDYASDLPERGPR